MAFGGNPTVLGKGSGPANSVVGGTGQFDDGSAAAPAVTFVSDPDTGVYRSAANTIGIAANGAARFAINTTSLAGVDATGSAALASVAGTNSLPSYAFTGDLDTGFYRSGANQVGVSCGTSTTVDFRSTGTYVAFNAGTTAGGSTTGLRFGNTGQIGVFFGSGAPTITAGQGSLYLRTDGSSTSTRLYVNTDGGTTWTNVTTAA